MLVPKRVPRFAVGPKAGESPEDLMSWCSSGLGPGPLSLGGSREPDAGAHMPGTGLRGEMTAEEQRRGYRFI